MSYNKENMVNYGFVKVAAATTSGEVADCKWNVSRMELLIKEAGTTRGTDDCISRTQH